MKFAASGGVEYLVVGGGGGGGNGWSQQRTVKHRCKECGSFFVGYEEVNPSEAGMPELKQRPVMVTGNSPHWISYGLHRLWRVCRMVLFHLGSALCGLGNKFIKCGSGEF